MIKNKSATKMSVIVVLQDGDNVAVICKGKRLNVYLPEFKLQEGDNPYEVAIKEFKEQLGHDIVNLIFKGQITTVINENGDTKEALIFKGTEFYTRPITSSKPENFRWIKKERLHRYSLGKIAEDIVNLIDAPCANYYRDFNSDDIVKTESISMVSELIGHEFYSAEDVIKQSFMTLSDTYAFERKDFPNFVSYAINKPILKWFLENGRRIFGYFDNERLIGCAMIFCNSINDMSINFLCVLPDYRHMKVGKSLLEHCIKLANDMNCNAINVEVMYENTRLKNWLIDHGFEIVKTENPINYPFTLAHMKKNLSE